MLAFASINIINAIKYHTWRSPARGLWPGRHGDHAVTWWSRHGGRAGTGPAARQWRSRQSRGDGHGNTRAPGGGGLLLFVYLIIIFITIYLLRSVTYLLSRNTIFLFINRYLFINYLLYYLIII